MSIPAIVVSVIDGEEKTLAEVCKGRRGVIDFWTTKCVRCPAALGKLNDEASSSTDLYIACALSQGEGNKDDVTDFVQDWENLTHVFAEMDVKEEMKAVFGFSAVPFYVVFDVSGSIVGSGEPKTFNYESALSSLKSKQNIESKLEGDSIAPASNKVFELDEDF